MRSAVFFLLLMGARKSPPIEKFNSTRRDSFMPFEHTLCSSPLVWASLFLDDLWIELAFFFAFSEGVSTDFIIRSTHCFPFFLFIMVPDFSPISASQFGELLPLNRSLRRKKSSFRPWILFLISCFPGHQLSLTLHLDIDIWIRWNICITFAVAIGFLGERVRWKKSFGCPVLSGFCSFEVLQERKKFVSLQSRCDQAFGKGGLFGKKERH